MSLYLLQHVQSIIVKHVSGRLDFDNLSILLLIMCTSRCEGLANSDKCTRLPVMVGLSYEVPKWYFTSPVPWNEDWSPALIPVNSLKIWGKGLRTTLASTFSRPADQRVDQLLTAHVP